jgi:hypothetical protein
MNERIDGPTSVVGERVKAARKQAAEARESLEDLRCTILNLAERVPEGKRAAYRTVDNLLERTIEQSRAVEQSLGWVQW